MEIEKTVNSQNGKNKTVYFHVVCIFNKKNAALSGTREETSLLFLLFTGPTHSGKM